MRSSRAIIDHSDTISHSLLTHSGSTSFQICTWQNPRAFMHWVQHAQLSLTTRAIIVLVSHT